MPNIGSRHVYWLAIAGLLMVAIVAPAGAQTQQQVDRCLNEVPPDLAIASCTALIQRWSGKDKGWAFGQRGFHYHTKKDYDRAIADFNQAIRLEPGQPEHFINRGTAYRAKAIAAGRWQITKAL